MILRSANQIGTKDIEAELEEANRKFEEAKELSSDAMLNFLDSEVFLYWHSDDL